MDYVQFKLQHDALRKRPIMSSDEGSTKNKPENNTYLSNISLAILDEYQLACEGKNPFLSSQSHGVETDELYAKTAYLIDILANEIDAGTTGTVEDAGTSSEGTTHHSNRKAEKLKAVLETLEHPKLSDEFKVKLIQRCIEKLLPTLKNSDIEQRFREKLKHQSVKDRNIFRHSNP